MKITVPANYPVNPAAEPFPVTFSIGSIWWIARMKDGTGHVMLTSGNLWIVPAQPYSDKLVNGKPQLIVDKLVDQFGKDD